jgi:hypothetical protein
MESMEYGSSKWSLSHRVHAKRYSECISTYFCADGPPWDMERRQYVAALGTVLASGLAGCSDGESPENGNGEGTPTAKPTATPGDGEGTPHPDAEEWHTTYREALESEDVEVDFSDVAGRRLVLDYNTYTTTEEDLVKEVELVAHTFAEVLESDWEIETAELWVLDPEIDDPQREAIMSYLVEAEWARTWRDGDLSDEGLLENINGTVEAYPRYREKYGSSETATDSS